MFGAMQGGGGVAEAAGMLISRKIRAIEIEEAGTVTRYSGEMVEESSWESPFKYKPGSDLKVNPLPVLAPCVCGHGKADHIPECIFIFSQDCKCGGYEEAVKADA